METSDEWCPLSLCLGPELFNIFISDIDSETECKLEDGMKLSGSVDTTEDRDAIQKDMDKTEEWAHEA